jgi:hypothetical protein
LQRLVIAKASKHLSPENRQQKKEKHCNFEVVGMRWSDLGEVIKTAGEQNGAANHPCDFEIGQALVIEHPVKFPKPDHSEHADQKPKQDLVTGEHDQQGDCPKRDRADEPQHESGTRRDHVRPGLLQRCRHAPASSRRNESGASADEPPIRPKNAKVERVVLNALLKQIPEDVRGQLLYGDILDRHLALHSGGAIGSGLDALAKSVAAAIAPCYTSCSRGR